MKSKGAAKSSAHVRKTKTSENRHFASFPKMNFMIFNACASFNCFRIWCQIRIWSIGCGDILGFVLWRLKNRTWAIWSISISISVVCNHSGAFRICIRPPHTKNHANRLINAWDIHCWMSIFSGFYAKNVNFRLLWCQDFLIGSMGRYDDIFHDNLTFSYEKSSKSVHKHVSYVLLKFCRAKRTWKAILGLWLTCSHFQLAFSWFECLIEDEYTDRKISASCIRWQHIHVENHPRTCAAARYCSCAPLIKQSNVQLRA